MIRAKRAYEGASASDGYRVLVDRLWPRGLRKDAAHLDGWLKEIAPSDALRKWFGHEPSRWPGFRERYKEELRGDEAKTMLDALADRARREDVTLVYAAHDTEHNNAVIVAEELARRLKRPVTKRPTASAKPRATSPRASSSRSSPQESPLRRQKRKV